MKYNNNGCVTIIKPSVNFIDFLPKKDITTWAAAKTKKTKKSMDKK
jgi:hypothetical protein